MDPTTSAPVTAPAQPVADTTMPATHAAVVSGSTSGYRDAKRAEKSGKPLPPVAVSAETPASDTAVIEGAPAASAQPAISKRQQDINDRIRKSTEEATVSLREENARLARELAAKTAPAPPVPEPKAAAPAPPPEKFASLQEWSEKNPTGTLEDYIDARAEFRETQRAESQRIEQEFKTHAEELTTLGQQFSNRMGDAIKAEPDLASKIPPAMSDPRASIPLSALSGEQLKEAKFSNLVAEAAFRSERPAELLKHLHAHQDDTVRIATIERQYGPLAALGALVALDRSLGGAPAVHVTAKPKPKTITSAPAPQETLGHRPAEQVDPIAAAVRSGDTRAFRQAKRAERDAGKR